MSLEMTAWLGRTSRGSLTCSSPVYVQRLLSAPWPKPARRNTRETIAVAQDMADRGKNVWVPPRGVEDLLVEQSIRNERPAWSCSVTTNSSSNRVRIAATCFTGTMPSNAGYPSLSNR